MIFKAVLTSVLTTDLSNTESGAYIQKKSLKKDKYQWHQYIENKTENPETDEDQVHHRTQVKILFSKIT